jgi:cytochrome P450
MTVSYGLTVSDSEDPITSKGEEALQGFSEAAVPGIFLVDLLPILKYVPSWFPGAGFKSKASHYSSVNAEVVNLPFKAVQRSIAEGTAVPCMLTSLLEEFPGSKDLNKEEQELISRHVTALAYIAGADTTVSSTQTFFLAMAMHPEAQRKAQAEIDAIVGAHRLPDLNDRPHLPYINAIVKELMRWQLVIPLGLAHMATDDDEYDGYFIPKGTIVIGASWSILHDPEIFEEPEEFRPERYLKDGQLDPSIRDPGVAAFGYGRRICPGRHMSDNSLYSIVSSVLAVYNIKAPLDEFGKPKEVKADYTSGFLSYPVPFSCTIEPRSKAADSLIRGLSD